MATTDSIVQTDNLAIGFGGTALLEGISLRVGSRDVVGIVGPNGAGKSTLLKTIAGILPPVAGSVGLAPNATVGYVPQQQAVDPIFPLTAVEVVRQGSIGKGARKLSRTTGRQHRTP